jgi:uncharacterized membrane protein (UPF0127 family)
MTIAGVNLTVLVCENDVEAALGLRIYSTMPEGFGMLIENTSAIHTRGMKFSIDVAWLDRDGRVLAWEDSVQPERECGTRAKGVFSCLELPAGFFRSHP